MNAVIDTNVLLSSLKSRTGTSFALLQEVRLGRITPVVSTPLVFEYDEVLNRPGMVPGFSPADIADFVDWFVSISVRQSIFFLWRPHLRDPKDDLVLEAAFAAGCRFVVSFNTRDFSRSEEVGVRCVSPFEMLNLLNPP